MNGASQEKLNSSKIAGYPPLLYHLFKKKLTNEFRRAGMMKIIFQKPDFVNSNGV
jgi:hypothetical protein